jgi:hypothetical protein
MQHRKRRDSLEQKLVIPSINTSPLSSSTAHLRGYPNPISSEFLGPDPDNNFLSYVPFSSLSAFLLCLTGVILFTTMMTWAFNATIEMVRRTLYITDMAWLDKVCYFDTLGLFLGAENLSFRYNSFLFYQLW